jgi:hypothetical protein
MSETRVPLNERLPEIYRIRDAEQTPPGQLAALLAAVEGAFGALHENIEALYQDLFIDTCDDWVVPYLADLLGTSHLKGDPRTLRADVADTIALRRRKGTLGAIERLAADLTGWPCRAVELFPGLAWSQHLNHQRPDAGGAPPYGGGATTRFTVPRGGTVPLRDPAMLSLLSTPFDPFAHTADVKRADDGAVHYNLPNLAVYLWRLTAFRIPFARPLAKGFRNLGRPASRGDARFALRFDIDPLDRPVRLFNTYRGPSVSAAGAVRCLTDPDAVPGPILEARLTSGSEAGNPAAYVTVDRYDADATPPTGLDLGDTGLQLYLPDDPVLDAEWTFRGDNLCAWEQGLRRPLGEHEIVVDPDIGRLLIGVATGAQLRALMKRERRGRFSTRLYLGYTYGAAGAVGAHPVSRDSAPAQIDGQAAELRVVSALEGVTLQDALAGLDTAVQPVVVEIRDSLVHDLDLVALPGRQTELGVTAMRLARSLVIRAASGQRPVVRLASPLAFRPTDPGDPGVASLSVRLEGLFVTRGGALADSEPLVARAALARLEIAGCTLDPGGHRLRDGGRAAIMPSLRLGNGYGFEVAAEEDAFAVTPDLLVQRSVTGPLLVDEGYRLTLTDAILDAGKAAGEPAGDDYALAAATDPDDRWGAGLDIRGATLLGRVRTARASGYGGLFVQRLEVWDHQSGCLKYCWFSGDGDRLPPNHACVDGGEARLVFTSIRHGDPGYAQLAAGTDFRVRERGPGDDAMGAFGFLLDAHRRGNLEIRLREHMPVGVRPLILAVT